jgi:hypothetical protein
VPRLVDEQKRYLNPPDIVSGYHQLMGTCSQKRILLYLKPYNDVDIQDLQNGQISIQTMPKVTTDAVQDLTCALQAEAALTRSGSVAHTAPRRDYRDREMAVYNDHHARLSCTHRCTPRHCHTLALPLLSVLHPCLAPDPPQILKNSGVFHTTVPRSPAAGAQPHNVSDKDVS